MYLFLQNIFFSYLRCHQALDNYMSESNDAIYMWTQTRWFLKIREKTSMPSTAWLVSVYLIEALLFCLACKMPVEAAFERDFCFHCSGEEMQWKVIAVRCSCFQEPLWKVVSLSGIYSFEQWSGKRQSQFFPAWRLQMLGPDFTSFFARRVTVLDSWVVSAWNKLRHSVEAVLIGRIPPKEWSIGNSVGQFLD